MKRPLFVFAGQSNMMGAAVYPASEQICYKNSFEYLHKPRRFGEPTGAFKPFGFPTGEFSYKDLREAYGDCTDAGVKSRLTNYNLNTYFCPAMCNLKDDATKETFSFEHFCEQDENFGVSLPPFLIKGLEDAGLYAAYTHIAKGGVPIKYYLSGESEKYFYEKTMDFFADCEKRFPQDDLSERVLVWHQGETEGGKGDHDAYVNSLELLWERARAVGFTKFLIIRVGFWGNPKIREIMRAQETFCKKTAGAYMLTRVASFLAWATPEPTGWFTEELPEEFFGCRDSFYGYGNGHLNEKAFRVIAKYALPNLIRIVYNEEPPLLEKERIAGLEA